MPTKKARVLYFCIPHGRSRKIRRDPYDYRFVEVLCRNYEVIMVYFVRSRGEQMEQRIAPEGVRLVRIRSPPIVRYMPIAIQVLIETVTDFAFVAFLVRNVCPDIVIGNWITRLGGLYCALLGLHPFLAIGWGSDVLIESKKYGILRVLGRFTIRAADAVIVDSEVQRKAIIDLGGSPSKIIVFPWGIDLDKFKPRKVTSIREALGWLEDKVVLSTRKHDRVYGIECLIRAIPLISSAVKGVKFLVAGSGPLLEYHRSLARDLGIGDLVRFVGYLNNDLFPAILNSADVYVSTAFSDGASASLMEAMACGLPVVVTRIPGNLEWVNHGENGFLVPPGDRVMLARYLSILLGDDELRGRMRMANLDLATARFDWKLNSLIFEKCVSGLLASRTAKDAHMSRSAAKRV